MHACERTETTDSQGSSHHQRTVKPCRERPNVAGGPVPWGSCPIDSSPPTGEPDPADAALRVIRERLAAAGKPCAFGAPVGHGDRNEAIPFGAACELDLDRGVLEILEGAVV